MTAHHLGGQLSTCSTEHRHRLRRTSGPATCEGGDERELSHEFWSGAGSVRDPREGTPRRPLGRLVRRHDPHPAVRRHHRSRRAGRRPVRAPRPAAQGQRPRPSARVRNPRQSAPPKEYAMTTDTRTAHTTTTAGPTPARPRMDPTRKVALAGGIAYLVTFAASIPQLKLFADVIADPTGYISNPGSNAAVQWGSVLEFLTAASGVATAVILYPVPRRVSRTAAIGFVTSRVVEAALILVGVVSILSVLALQQHFAGATGAQEQALGVAGEALVAMRQWTFLLGPGVMAGVNDLLLGYILYRSGLVGRVIPIIGLVGGPLILVSDLATILGIWGQTSTFGFLFGLPVVVFEFSVGVHLTVKGFRPAGLAALDAPTGSTPDAVAVT